MASLIDFYKQKLAPKLTNFLNTQVTLPKPLVNVATNLANANPGKIISQGLLNNQPLQKFSQAGLRTGYQVNTNPQQFNVLSAGLTGRNSAPEPIRQAVGQGLESASFGLLRNRVPEPTTTAGKVGKFAGGVVGSIPAFTAGTALLGGTTRNIGNLSRLGRTALDLGVGATSMALTTPGSLKERAASFKENVKDPLQIAMSLALPFGANAVAQSEKKVVARKVGEALKKELEKFDLPKIDVSEKPKWNMRVKTIYEQVDEPLFKLRNSLKEQEARVIANIKQSYDRNGKIDSADALDIMELFKRKIKGVRHDKFTPEVALEEMWQHAKNNQVQFASDIKTPKLSVEPVGGKDFNPNIVYRTENAHSTWKGKSVYGKGKYFAGTEEGAGNLQIDPKSFDKWTPEMGGVDAYEIPKTAKIKTVNTNTMSPEEYKAFSSKMSWEGGLEKAYPGYDGIRIEGGDGFRDPQVQIVLFNEDIISKTKKLPKSPSPLGGKPVAQGGINDIAPSKGGVTEPKIVKPLREVYKEKLTSPMDQAPSSRISSYQATPEMGRSVSKMEQIRQETPKQILSSRGPSSSTPILSLSANQPKLIEEGKYRVNTAKQARSLVKKGIPVRKIEINPKSSVSNKPITSQPGQPMIAKNKEEARIMAKKYPGANIILQSGETPLIPRPNIENMPRTNLTDIEKRIYGSESIVTPIGNKNSVGLLGDNLRKVEAGISSRVEQGLSSPNPVVRGVASFTQDLFGGAGKSSEQIANRRQYRGGIDYATKIASDTQNQIYDLLGRDTKSLERVHSVLDPEISKIKVNEGSLTTNEKQAVETLRQVSDFINDTNFKNGFISEEQWLKNRGGKYITRAYEEFDYPPEIADFIKNKDIRFDLNPFKTRGEVTDWKVENSIKDPAYLTAKRMQQTMFNSSVKQYTEWAKNSGMISDVARPGYVQLSDSRAYGDAAGKWIRKDALEDVKGFFVTNDIGQKAYELLNWYDKNPLRRTQKMLKTVFNPAVRLGNKTGNYVFAWLNGINPATFNKNKRWADTAIKNNDPLFRWASQQGIMGTDVTKADIARVSAELSRKIEDPGTLKKLIDELQTSYGRVDDASKLSALKTWIDRGVDPIEALNRVGRGFQDYNMVGFLYDLGAKLPVLGNPFVRFASESIRIAKNAAVDHPIRTIGTLAAWSLFTDVMSRISGETSEDKKTRETRVGASHLPFTNISTNVQTPWGEVNVSRLLGFSTTFTPEDATLADLSKYSPIQNPLDKRNYGSDPLIGPLISVGMDTDFRGKSIADPKSNKYTGSTLTSGERLANRVGFLGRSYLPPTATDIYNLGAAIQGKENVYGQKKSPLQAVARIYPGVKIEKYGPEEAQKRRADDAYYEGLKNEGVQKQINSVKKQLLKGEITQEQADKRINSLQKGIKTVTPISGGGTYSYIRKSDGSLQNIDVSSVTSLPESTNYERVKKDQEKWKIADDILNLPEEQQSEALSALGISQKDAEYYQVAKDTTEAKVAYIKDQVQGVKTYDEFLKKVVPLAREINGSAILSEGVIDWLYNNDIITSAQKKQLKSLEFKDGKVQIKSGSAKSTYVEAKLPASAKTALPKVKRIRTKTYKLVVPKTK